MNAERETKRWPGRKPAGAAVKQEQDKKGTPRMTKNTPPGDHPQQEATTPLPRPRRRPQSLCLQKFVISFRNLLPPTQKRAVLGGDACNNRAWPTLRPQTRWFASSRDRESGGTRSDPQPHCNMSPNGQAGQRNTEDKGFQTENSPAFYLQSYKTSLGAAASSPTPCLGFKKGEGKKKQGWGS